LIRVGIFSGSLFAQNPDETDAEPIVAEASAVQEITTIELSKVPEESQKVASEITGFTDLGNDRLLTEIETRMPRIQNGVEQITRRLMTVRQHRVSAQRLTAVRTNVETIIRQLSDWQDDASDTAARLERTLEETEQMSQLWEQTRDQAIAAGAPGTVITQLRATVSSINRTQGNLLDQRDRALEVLGEVGIELRKVTRMEAELSKMLMDSRSHLLQRNSPPIWEIYSTPNQASRTVDGFSGYVRENFPSCCIGRSATSLG